MPKIKNWLKRGKGTWVNTEIGVVHISIKKSGLHKKMYGTPWILERSLENTTKIISRHKTFKTAYRAAIRYMRNHPHGL